jgi:site-specific DNA-methyltransferase (adenine-specific)
MQKQEEDSIDAIVTDPPYGVVEYSSEELKKKRSGKGGIWRLPPVMDGCIRQPQPRFSVINESPEKLQNLQDFFEDFGEQAMHILKPGGHVMLASTSLLEDYVSVALRRSGLERRGEVIRIVKTFRGGDRPKGHEKEFPNVTVIPRGNWEPWLIFRKPISEHTVSENLKKWGTGGLRRTSEGSPFTDVIYVDKTPKRERLIDNHPSIKPQELMRLLVHASLPLGKGTVLDPFMGSGSTIAAAEAQGFNSIGVEIDKEYFDAAKIAIPELAKFRFEDDQTLNVL